MRLVRVPQDNRIAPKLELIDYTGTSAVPRYAILSHTWNNDEVSFDDVHNGPYERKQGYRKIKFAMAKARENGYQYLWVDTCCINKSSSAELSEGINSMYEWYKHAGECYAYLEDVTCERNSPAFAQQLIASRWFTRGWTLQELLAPRTVLFFNRDMQPLGNKVSLQREISKITTIPTPYIIGNRSIRNASVARRMSWAAGRQTTREEDVAYCLMGIFNVNMPMLYGEGKKAFLRLQEEIMKVSDDQSLLAWTMPPPDASSREQTIYHGLLADSPRDFKDSGNYLPQIEWTQRSPFHMTNRGLQIELEIERIRNDVVGGHNYAATLECSGRPCIYLKKLSARSNLFARVYCDRLGKSSRGTESLQVCIPRDFHTAHDAVMDYFPTRIKVTNKSRARCLPCSSRLHTAFYEGTSIYEDLAAYPDSGGLLEIPCKWGAAASVTFEIQQESKARQQAKYLEFTIGVTNEQKLDFSVVPTSEWNPKKKAQPQFSPKPTGVILLQDYNVKTTVKSGEKRDGGRIEYICNVIFEDVQS